LVALVFARIGKENLGKIGDTESDIKFESRGGALVALCSDGKWIGGARKFGEEYDLRH
jgi:hypothetical protein